MSAPLYRTRLQWRWWDLLSIDERAFYAAVFPDLVPLDPPVPLR